MKPDLKSMTRKELEKLKANVEKALLRVSTKEKKKAREAAEKAAAAHGFSLAEITGDPAPKKRGPKPPSISASAPCSKFPQPKSKATSSTSTKKSTAKP